MRRKMKRMALWLLGLGLTWCIILGTIVWKFGQHDQAIQSDCIIVLGAATRGTTASPVYAERIQHGINLYKAGRAPKLLFTGGIGDGEVHSESSIGQSIAIQQGVSASDLLMEEKSRTTQQNLSEARDLMKQHQLVSAIIVSDPLHMKRAMLMAEDLGMTARSSPTPTSRYRSLKTKLGFLVREIYFIHHYFVTGN